MKRILALFVLSAVCVFADQLSDARAAMNRGELVNAEQILNVVHRRRAAFQEPLRA